MLYKKLPPGWNNLKLLAPAAVVLVLGGCAGFRAGPTALASCTDLGGTQIAAGLIGKPTSGASVNSAALVAADPSTQSPEYCKVLGAIAPVDRTAPPINFQVNLPTQWNNKALHFGGGGFNGTLVAATAGSTHTAPAGTLIPTPLARGYVTFGSDGGHKGTAFDGSFALNDEALRNYGGEQLKKTHDAVYAIIAKRYGSVPKKLYFAGGSQGGHEGFSVIQRWPQDYDGVIAYYPGHDFMGNLLSFNRELKTFFGTPGAALSVPKRALLRRSVYAACDGLDGAVDGIISNLNACATAFNVSNLRCASGTDEGDMCLSDVQITALNLVKTPNTLPFALNGGRTTYPGRPIFLGADIEGILFGPGLTREASAVGRFESDFVRYFVTKDPNFDTLTLNVAQWSNRGAQLSAIIDDTSVEIDAFRARGGKLIMVHGTADYLVAPEATVEYFNRLIGKFGRPSVDAFARLYLVPGLGHGAGVFNASWDSVAALDAWRETGVAPSNQVAADSNAATLGRTRPLCEYGTWPKYKGTGDINSAVSFACMAR